MPRSGDPNGTGLPHWPALDLQQRQTLVFDSPESRLAADPGGDDLRAMSAFLLRPGSALSFRAD
jgi:carboxylesterase type B